MSKFTKLATCLFIALAGIIGYFVYLSMDTVADAQVSIEIIKGNEEVLDELKIRGSVSSNNLWMYEPIIIENSEAQPADPPGFFDQLDTTWSNPVISSLRLNNKSFMRTRGINASSIETESHLYVANIEGDYNYNPSDTLIIGVLDKETEEERDFSHRFDLPNTNYFHSPLNLYQEDNIVIVLTNHFNSIDGRELYTVTQFNLDTNESTQTTLNTDMLAQTYDSRGKNERFAIFSKIDESLSNPSDDAIDGFYDPYYLASLNDDYYYLDFTTSEALDLPAPPETNPESAYYIAANQTIYAIESNFSENTVTVYTFDPSSNSWSDEITVPIEADPSSESPQSDEEIANEDLVDHSFGNNSESSITVEDDSGEPYIQHVIWKDSLIIIRDKDDNKGKLLQMNSLENGALILQAKFEADLSDDDRDLSLALFDFY